MMKLMPVQQSNTKMAISRFPILVALLSACLTSSLVSARFDTATTIPLRTAPAFARRRSNISSSSRRQPSHSALSFLDDDNDHKVQQCASGSGTSLAKDLLYGAFLRVASDLTLGTPLESIKCRATGDNEGWIKATKDIVKEGGIQALWAGTPSRTIEGSLLGAIYLLGASVTKKQVLALGGSPTMAALCGGLVGGVAQSIVMTPAGMVFTSLNLNRGKKGYENDNAWRVTKRIVQEKGILGMYAGIGPMALRQATNWASRSCFTEIARTTFKMSQYGMLGEIGSGIIGGVGSCWNTPIETIRVLMQADVSAGRPTKSFIGYWDDIVEDSGYAGLFRGVTPRAIQACWQTIFMVVVPNVLGL